MNSDPNALVLSAMLLSGPAISLTFAAVDARNQDYRRGFWVVLAMSLAAHAIWLSMAGYGFWTWKSHYQAEAAKAALLNQSPAAAR